MEHVNIQKVLLDASAAEDNLENCDIYESAIKDLVRVSLLRGFFGEDIKRVY